jgi:2'-5' RNA ligase
VSDERARLFVALELPQEVCQALATWRSQITSRVAGLRPLPEDHLHVTLCFLGWQPVEEVQAIGQTCRQLSPGDPAPLSLGEGLWLPPRRPRVLAVGLSEGVGPRDVSEHVDVASHPSGSLSVIQAELSMLLTDGGWYEPERRPYLPHVTVARAGRRDRVAPSPLPDPPALSFTASSLTLFRSRLSSGGGRYEALSSVSLISTA